MNEEKDVKKKTAKKPVKKNGTNGNRKSTSKVNTTKKKTNSKSNNASKKPSTKKVNTAKKANTAKKQPPKNAATNKPVVKEEKVVVQEEVIKEPVIEEISVKKEVKEEVPINNYVSIISVVVMAILMLILFANLYSNALFNKYSPSWDGKSYLVEKSNVHQLRCDEIPNAITGEKSFILVTDAVGEEEYELEKNLAKVIQERNIKNDFYVYVLNDNCGPITSGSSIASTNLQLPNGLSKVPTILYYRNGYYIDKVTRLDQNMINDGDFVHLLDMYEVK